MRLPRSLLQRAARRRQLRMAGRAQRAPSPQRTRQRSRQASGRRRKWAAQAAPARTCCQPLWSSWLQPLQRRRRQLLALCRMPRCLQRARGPRLSRRLLKHRCARV